MDVLQLLIICAGLSGQVLIARKDHRGYLCWMVGNVALVWVYQDAHQFGLIALQLANTAIQIQAVRSWIRDHGRRGDVLAKQASLADNLETRHAGKRS